MYKPITVFIMEERLMICGNKTDQCLKCKKLIRRAVFAYRYENNYRDFNESLRILMSFIFIEFIRVDLYRIFLFIYADV